MTAYKEEFAAETDAPHARRRDRAAPTCSSASPSGGIVTPDMVQDDGAESDRLRASPIPIRRSATTKRSRRVPTRSWPPAAATYPNQVNNVLGFPFIFRGALDCRATTINEEMKLAAARALAELAKEDVPDSRPARVRHGANVQFGRDYLIPKPFDPRVLLWVPPAVARAAAETGVAQEPIRRLRRLPPAAWTTSPRARARRDARLSTAARGESRSASCSPRATGEDHARGARSSSTRESRTRSCSATRGRSSARSRKYNVDESKVTDHRHPRTSPERDRYAQRFARARASARASPRRRAARS